jgi:two-component system cell cycle response regulator
MKVLIAEDNTISCRALAGNLENWGYDVLVTRNGQEAWEAFNAHHPADESDNGSSIQVALLDWEMPKISGLDLCRKIRCQSGPPGSSYVYVILMTGRDHQEDILKGLSAGADDYMIKPFDHIELKIRVQNGARIAVLEKAKTILKSRDGSTLLWDRNQILEFLEEEILRNNRQNQPTGIVLMGIEGSLRADIDHKISSDERLISEMAQRLKCSMRRYDKLSRFDKNEFLGVFPNCRLEHLHIIAERLRRAAVDAPHLREGKAPPVSLGGTSSEHILDCTGSDLLNTAYQALRSAREQGGGRIMIKPPERKF